MRIVALGDSLGLPRPKQIQSYSTSEKYLAVTYDQVYTSILQRRLIEKYHSKPYVEVINRAQRSNTIVDIYNEFADHLYFFEPNILILQVGIVDCWYRDHLGGKQFVNIDLFKIHVIKILKMLSLRPECKLIIVGICPTSEKMNKRYPGLNEQIMQYNEIYKSQVDNNRIFYIDMEKYVDPENIYLYLLLDDQHLNKEGNEIVADEIFKIITSIINKQLIGSTDGRSENTKDDTYEKIRIKVLDRDYLKIDSISKSFNLYIFGAGKGGLKFKNFLDSEGIEFIGFIDNDTVKWNNKLEGKQVFSLNQVINNNKENHSKIFIVICSVYYKEIIEQLNNLELKHEVNYLIQEINKANIWLI